MSVSVQIVKLALSSGPHSTGTW